MFYDASPFPNRRESSRKAAAIVTLFLSDAGALHCERLPEPHLAPALAWRMAHARPRPVIESRVAAFRPCVHAGQTGVAAIFLDEKSSHKMRANKTLHAKTPRFSVAGVGWRHYGLRVGGGHGRASCVSFSFSGGDGSGIQCVGS